MTKPSRPAKPSPAPATNRRSLAAVARSVGGERSLVALLGLVLLAAGVLVVLLSYGVFGGPRATRPLLDPMIVEALRANPLVARLVAIVAGLLLALLGLMWAARSLRPEPRPDLVLDGGPDTSIVVTSGAAAEAVAAQAGALPGVGRARARLVGPQHSPALRITLWLTDDAHVADVLDRLYGEVIAGVRTSLGIDSLPVAVRLELNGVPPPPRVA
jgi:multisubunit Na+/H+ antiporter MnhC subunit